jgi:hypothetical protein
MSLLRPFSEHDDAIGSGGFEGRGSRGRGQVRRLHRVTERGERIFLRIKKTEINLKKRIIIIIIMIIMFRKD